MLDSISEDFKLFVMHIMSEVKRLDIPFILTARQAKLQKRYTAALELITSVYSSLTLYLDNSNGDYPQSIWKTQENFLFLVLFTDTNSDSYYHDIVDRLWNERGIMNVLYLF